MHKPMAKCKSFLIAIFAGIFVSLLMPQISYAVNPDEVLSDPILEQRARDLSVNLRCLVCQNQSIDDSDAALARDLRLLVRERLVAGDDDIEVIDYVVSRYGEFILLQPRFGLHTIFLWSLPIILILIGFVIALRKFRTTGTTRIGRLTVDESARINKLIDG